MKPSEHLREASPAHSEVECQRNAAPLRWNGRIWIWAAVMCGALSLTAVNAEAWTRDEVLHAIHQVENPTNSPRVGRSGELGPYQFRPVVWRMHTSKPFLYAADRAEAKAVAEMHYDWITRGLQRNGCEVSPYHVALAWNAGLSATVNGRVGKSSRHYARRVANLVEHEQPSGSDVAQR